MVSWMKLLNIDGQIETLERASRARAPQRRRDEERKGPGAACASHEVYIIIRHIIEYNRRWYNITYNRIEYDKI